MSKRTLWIVAAIAGAIAVGVALWARNTYTAMEASRGYLYTAQGYSMAQSLQMAAADASAAISAPSVIAWVLAGVAGIMLLAALLRPTGTGQEPSPQA